MAEYEAGVSEGVDVGEVEGAEPSIGMPHDAGLNYSFSFELITEPIRTVPQFVRTIP
jgi:hypothetical protein